MIKVPKKFLFVAVSTAILSGCNSGSSGSSTGAAASVSTIAVTATTPGVVSSAGATKTFTWTITATKDSNLAGFNIDHSPVSGTLTVNNNTCTGQLLAGNSCNITFSYTAPNNVSAVSYQTPTFTYANGNNSVSKTGYIDVFPMFYTVPQNASEGQSGPANNFVNKMAMNDQGCLYIATSNGLSISCDKGQTFSHRTTANGLPTNTINDIVVNGQTIYAGTNNLSGGPTSNLHIDSIAVSTDGGNNFTPVALTGNWPDDAGGVYLSMDANKVVHAVSSFSNNVANITQGGNVSLSQIGTGNQGYAIGSSAANVTYVDSYDSNYNPAVYSSADNYQNPIFSSPAYISDAFTFYNPKDSTDIYVPGFGYLGKANNASFTSMTYFNLANITNNSVNTISANNNYIYAGLGNDQGLAYSNDGGASFTYITDTNSGLATPNVQYVYIPASDFLLNNVTDNNVYIATQDLANMQNNVGGLSVGTLGSTSFTNHTGVTPMPVFSNASFRFNTITAMNTYTANGQDVVLAGSTNGFEYSFDGGKTFGYIDTSSYGQVNAFAVVGGNLIVGTSSSTGGAMIRYPISLSRVLNTPTVLNNNVAVYDLAAQGNNIVAATSTGLLYSTDGGSIFSIATLSLNPISSSNNWKKLTIYNNMLYAVTNTNEVYYGQLTSLPAINLSSVAISVPLNAGAIPQKLYAYNNTLYFAT